ncbi:MAG: TIGR02300 family protein [Rhodospirillaceae bacterium]|nr:TIGR02300 family protein [Rhodospirillales bacterium]
MAKPEWGQKRTCTSCTCRFYDMHRSPITCPKCGGTVEPELPFKVRRGGSVPAESKAAAAALKAKEAVAVVADDLALDDEDVIEGAEENADEDESGLIEDASDLGEDDDDMAEVMEHMDEELGDEV